MDFVGGDVVVFVESDGEMCWVVVYLVGYCGDVCFFVVEYLVCFV